MVVPLPSAARGNAVAIKSSQILSAIGRPVSLQQRVHSGIMETVSSTLFRPSFTRFRVFDFDIN